VREFRRSRLFGLVGVFVVAGIAIVIALSADSSDPNPKLQEGLIFGVIAVFVVLLLFFQRGDMNRAASGDARSFAKGAQEVDDPTKLADGELWSALAVHPIDDDAIKARREVWDAGRRSLKLGAAICALIFLSVPPIYLFDTFVPLFIGGALIGILALYGSYRAIGPGGEVDSTYDRMDRAMKPLGLSLTERPTVRMVPRAPTMPGYSGQALRPDRDGGGAARPRGRRAPGGGGERGDRARLGPGVRGEVEGRPVRRRQRHLKRSGRALEPARFGPLEGRQGPRRPGRRRCRPQGRSERLALRPLAGGANRRADLGRAGGETDPRSHSR
jgi:hypothetical protein